MFFYDFRCVVVNQQTPCPLGAKVDDPMELTPSARKVWEAIPTDRRLRILNNVYCVGCMKTTSMGKAKGRVEKGRLALSGVCTRCGGVVARVVELR